MPHRSSSASAGPSSSQQQNFENHLGQDNQHRPSGTGQPQSQPIPSTPSSPISTHAPNGSTQQSLYTLANSRPPSPQLSPHPTTTPANPASASSQGVQSGQSPDNLGTNGVTGNAGLHQVNNNPGSFYTTNNSGRITTASNTGLYSSSGNTGNEYIGHNSGNVQIANSAGNHVVNSNNGGNVSISNLQPGANVLVNQQHGRVTQTFPEGSFMNWRHPEGVTHGPSAKPLELDQYGSGNFTNVSANLLRNPGRYIPEYGGVVAGAGLTGAVLVNNGFAAPASLSSSVAAGQRFGGG